MGRCLLRWAATDAAVASILDTIQRVTSLTARLAAHSRSGCPLPMADSPDPEQTVRPASRFGRSLADRSSLLGTVKTSLSLLGSRPSRVARLIGLGIVASAMEAMGALLLLFVFRVVSDANAPLSMPVVGDLHDRFPEASRNTILLYFCLLVAAFFLLRSVVLL